MLVAAVDDRRQRGGEAVLDAVADRRTSPRPRRDVLASAWSSCVGVDRQRAVAVGARRRSRRASSARRSAAPWTSGVGDQRLQRAQQRLRARDRRAARRSSASVCVVHDCEHLVVGVDEIVDRLVSAAVGARSRQRHRGRRVPRSDRSFTPVDQVADGVARRARPRRRRPSACAFCALAGDRCVAAAPMPTSNCGERRRRRIAGRVERERLRGAGRALERQIGARRRRR